MNPILKRDALQAKLKELLQYHDREYVVENRLRENTFDGSRDSRIRVMGDKYTYAECLGPFNVQTTPGRRSAKSTTGLKVHSFVVNIWLRYRDSNAFSESSQAKWDSIVWDSDRGVIQQLEATPQLSIGNNLFTLGVPQSVDATMVNMDYNDLKEKAHYITFNIEVHDT